MGGITHSINSCALMVSSMKRIHFSLPVDEDTNMVIRMIIEEFRKASGDSFSVDVTMEQLIDFRDLLNEVIAENDRSEWL
jgi:hypothetical protein